MKTIGVITALEEEFLLIKSKMEVISAKNIIGLDFYTGKMERKNLVLVRSGMGKVNAAICAQVLIDFYGVDCIINTGVAEAVSKELAANDIVIGQEFVHHDFDASPMGVPVGVIPLMESAFKTDEELTRIIWEAISLALPDRQLFTGRIATGDQLVSDKTHKQFIRDNFKAYCTEMEGAAIAQTCDLNKIPFAAVRVISGSTEEESSQVAKSAALIVEQMIRML